MKNYVLLQGVENRLKVMLQKEDMPQEIFALASNGNGGNANFTGSGFAGRVGGHGARGGSCGGCMSGRGRGGGEQDKLLCTHCRRHRHPHKTFSDLVGRNHSASATPAESGQLSHHNNKEKSFEQHWKEELMLLK